MVAWQYTAWTKGDGLLVTADEREGRNCLRACGDTDREKLALRILKLGFPLLSGVSSTCFSSSPSKYSHQGFSLTPPFSRKLSVLPPQLVSLASKNPAALSVQMSYLLHPDLCLHRPAGHARERGGTHRLRTAVARGPQLPSSC